ncbi:Gfo/Idh/MocA family protein [Nocardia miyunensis]|uniref:Gfo/Idh/MocA family protein n=1 Tax=Nocardia miyunensis TaxID=282684 RepID=UPI00082C1854|nr:Gfo/Idh/MocA family oxidoreductase [Nocardia miyunensis]
MTLRIAIIGAGLAGRSHALDIVTDPTMQLAGVAAAHQDSAGCFADDFGTAVYPNAEAILSDRHIDAVVIAVPPKVVFDIAEGVDTEKPCLIEKPIPATVADRRRLVRLAADHPHMIVPFNRRYQPTVLHAADCLQSGVLGAVVSVDAVWRGPYAARFAPSSGTYRSHAGPRHGVLIDTGSHALDVLAVLLGQLPHPSRLSSRITGNLHGTDIAAELVFEGEPRTRVALVDDPGAHDCGGWSVTATCEQGSLHLAEDGLLIHTPSLAVQRHPAEPMERPVTDLVRIRDGSPPLGASLREILPIGDIVIAAHNRSCRTASTWIRPRGKALGRLNGSC